ncbi:hypothetical protein L226DRAFT_58825 [Lentinus tigrinus ALCF2SS1-7]|uniref:uncharacterized protein n=1 Tax=Lentinus tigrinus ALCF2SS1-7 TaxID=1328758 RepID=UPI001165F384|nr:hypothetical protein L226DRAFT_58825 [Lentinus tigrinus ALCF2SS1-7]
MRVLILIGEGAIVKGTQNHLRVGTLGYLHAEQRRRHFKRIKRVNGAHLYALASVEGRCKSSHMLRLQLDSPCGVLRKLREGRVARILVLVLRKYHQPAGCLLLSGELIFPGAVCSVPSCTVAQPGSARLERTCVLRDETASRLYERGQLSGGMYNGATGHHVATYPDRITV